MAAKADYGVYGDVSLNCRMCADEDIRGIGDGSLIRAIFMPDVIIFRITIRPANDTLRGRNCY